MTGRPDPEHPYASTTWRWKTVKIPLPAEGQRRQRPQGGHSANTASVAPGWYRFPSYDLKRKRELLTIRISYRGGSECWYEVKARGSSKRFPGHMALHDIMRQIYND